MKNKTPLFIQHRINTIDQLKEVPREYGIEIDIRAYQNKIILNHESFESGDSFDDFLEHYNHKFLIINMKCDGPEIQILEKLKEKSVQDFFFLDSSLPTIVNLMNSGIKNIAIRYSKYEPIEFVEKFKNMVDWVWIDCFDGFDLNKKDYLKLRKWFKICLVSPELQKFSLSQIQEFKSLSKEMYFDAICTKLPSEWK